MRTVISIEYREDDINEIYDNDPLAANYLGEEIQNCLSEIIDDLYTLEGDYGSNGYFNARIYSFETELPISRDDLIDHAFDTLEHDRTCWWGFDISVELDDNELERFIEVLEENNQIPISLVEDVSGLMKQMLEKGYCLKVSRSTDYLIIDEG